jgi:hypothetical protein
MINLTEVLLSGVAVHYCGNKQNGEHLSLSAEPLVIKPESVDLLQKFFLSSFKHEEFFHLDGIQGENPVMQLITELFEDPGLLVEKSRDIAKYLYEQSLHPRIKSGEFYLAYFSGCIVDDELTDAIGLFKSESRDTFLKVNTRDTEFDLSFEQGINVNKLDKGCLIFNTEKDQGYLVSVVDNLNRSAEAQYWREDFLRLKPRQDAYFQTSNYLNLCKSFAVEKMPEDFQATKTDQVEMLNKSAGYFKEHTEFDFQDFTAEVLKDPEKIEAFKEYKQYYEEEFDVNLQDDFDIAKSAVKKQSKVFKSVIKLDRNFHIYVHGDRERIVKGFDPSTGLHFYQIFFEEET